MATHKALGRGLSALIPETEEFGAGPVKFFQCPIEMIEPNPYQPRQAFDGQALEELAASVKEQGILTPLLVSKTEKGYRLIAGERRWRAAQKAGLARVPVVVRETTPVQSLELALIENIHRKDLNPIEEGMAYSRLLENPGATQESLAATIANMVRLLKLPTSIQKDLMENRISMGHARVLAGLKDGLEQKAVRDEIIRKDLSVRQTEALVKRRSRSGASRPRAKGKDPYLQSLADSLKSSLGTKVEIKKRGKQGSILIYFLG